MLRMLFNWAAGMSEGIKKCFHFKDNLSCLLITWQIPEPKNISIKPAPPSDGRGECIWWIWILEVGNLSRLQVMTDKSTHIELRSIPPREIYPWIDNSKNAYGYCLASVYCFEDLLKEFCKDWTQIHFSHYQCHWICSASGHHIRSRN